MRLARMECKMKCLCLRMTVLETFEVRLLSLFAGRSSRTTTGIWPVHLLRHEMALLFSRTSLDDRSHHGSLDNDEPLCAGAVSPQSSQRIVLPDMTAGKA